MVPARYLPGQVLMMGDRHLAPSDKWGATFPTQKGAAIWQFSGNATRGILMAAMREQGIRVLMEVDDNYTMPAEFGGWDLRIDRKTDNHSYEAHVKLCKFVDGITVSTPNLESYYSKLNKNVYVCPNSLDPKDWEWADGSHKPNDGILRIGWGGSASHALDAPLVQRAFAWASEQKDVEVYVFGIGEAAKFPRKVNVVPWTDDQDEYRRKLAMCDVQVCPLVETPWSAGKSDWKALDAAAGYCWPIVSTAEPYKPWHDKTMTCTTPKEWLHAIKWVVRHRDEIPRLAKEARDYAWSQRLMSQNVWKWEAAING